MVCYHPMSALVLGTKPNGRKDMKILSFDPKLDYEHNPKRGKYFELNGRMYSIDNVIHIPCQQCYGCRLDRSRQWADRCMLEMEDHDSAYFVTLTYDNDHIPIRKYVTDYSTGEFDYSFSLVKRDFQLFMKRLRYYFPNDKIRYFASGEYGTETLRPHYHAIIFGLHLNDLVPWSKSELGYQYYNSASLQRAWSDVDGYPIGFAVVGECTWETCAYTARYVMKKRSGAAALEYDLFNVEPEFSTQSRDPGIARNYYDTHPHLFNYNYIYLENEKGGRKIKPPKYYEKLYEIDNPEHMAEIKQMRQKMSDVREKMKLKRTSLYSDELRQVEENNKKAVTSALRRNII